MIGWSSFEWIDGEGRIVSTSEKELLPNIFLICDVRPVDDELPVGGVLKVSLSLASIYRHPSETAIVGMALLVKVTPEGHVLLERDGQREFEHVVECQALSWRAPSDPDLARKFKHHAELFSLSGSVERIPELPRRAEIYVRRRWPGTVDDEAILHHKLTIV